MDDSDLCNSPELVKFIDSGDAFSLVADTAGKILGWLVVHTKFQSEYGWAIDADTVRLQSEENAYLEIINVSANSRSKGIGKQLICAAELEAKTLGKSKIWLHVRDDNIGAIRFYEREQWTHDYSVTPEWRNGQCMRLYSKSLICSGANRLS
jgi:ribosomal protein S18 acetylase RimI-like enzyme